MNNTVNQQNTEEMEKEPTTMKGSILPKTVDLSAPELTEVKPIKTIESTPSTSPVKESPLAKIAEITKQQAPKKTLGERFNSFLSSLGLIEKVEDSPTLSGVKKSDESLKATPKKDFKVEVNISEKAQTATPLTPVESVLPTSAEKATIPVLPTVNTIKPEVNTNKSEPKIAKEAEVTEKIVDKKPKANNEKSPVAGADKKVAERVTFGLGVNLIPPMKEEVIVHEEKKSKFNISAAIAILLFVLLSLGILGYSIILKQQLADEQKKLQSAEADISTSTTVLRKNVDLESRISLYKTIQEGTTSYKEVVDYWKKISNTLATINSIKLGDELSFDVTGYTDNLLSASKLWHFLSIDDRVLDVNLKSVSISSTRVNFEFEGKLNFESFRNK